MKTLRIVAAAGGRTLLELQGDPLVFDQKVVRSIRLVRIAVGDGTWIRFDTDPALVPSGAKLPPDWGVPGEALFFEGEPGSGNEYVLGNKSFIRLQLHVASPLTPHGGGLLLRIWVQYLDGKLVIHAHPSDKPDEKPGLPRISALWYRKPGRWWPVAFAALGTKQATPQQWIKAWDLDGIIPYTAAEADELLCPLTDGKSAPWLVDLRGRPHHKLFTAGVLEPSDAKTGDRQLGYQVVAPRGRRSWAPVSAAALAGQDGAGATVLEAGDVALRCARALRNGRATDTWLVDWMGVPAAAPVDRPSALAFPTLYTLLARHYTLGLAAARARNKISAVPTGVTGATDQVFALRYRVTAAGASLEEIITQQSFDLDLTLGSLLNIDRTAPRLLTTSDQPIRALHEVAGAYVPATHLFDVTLTARTATAGATALRTVVGGVVVMSNQLQRGRLALRHAPPLEYAGQRPVEVNIELGFVETSIEPATQDPEAGFESASVWLQRERPLVISLRDPEANLNLLIAESASAQQSRLLRLTLRAGGDGSIGEARLVTSDAVVIDPSPFTVARVSAEARVRSGDIVAEFTDDAELPSEWNFRSEGGGMLITLPPQTIGEEMVKGRLFLREGGNTTEVPLLAVPPSPPRIHPFDFRLGAPAFLSLDRTEVDTARAIAPWALRRLLSLRLGSVGAKTDAAQFELFYGLTTRLHAEGLRIAELDAFVGRIPLADELAAYLRHPRSGSESVRDTLRRTHARYVGRWIRDLLYRPTWWPLFRSWVDRQALTVSDDVEFELRGTRQTAHPFVIHRRAVDVNSQTIPPPPIPSQDADRRPLRGGIDWPFQSPTIYKELVGPDHRGRPRPGTGSISGVAFGTLGGTGKQSAVFSGGKTLVLTDTTQGRLNAVTVIRLGRIAMFWNQARHVIVYERTSRRAARYALGSPDENTDLLDWQSPRHDGFAALRKVREYIEVTQPRRTYPDTPTTRPITGPLVQSTFETTVIPVKASWGRDVEQGWVMPLRGPLSADEAPHFPEPTIFLDLARAEAKGGGSIGHKVADPSELLFFTSTRDDGGDTDLWPSWPDIDYPLVPPPDAPEVPIAPSFAGAQRQANAVAAEFGQRAFSVTLQPPGEGANLAHGRPGEGIDALVHSVSLARGRPNDSRAAGVLGTTLVPTFSAHAASVKDALTELADHFTQLAASDPGATLAERSGLAADARALLQRVESHLGTISGAITAASGTLDAHRFSWVTEQDSWIAEASARRARLLANAKEQLHGAKEVKENLRHTLESVATMVTQEIDGLGYLPELAMRRLRDAVDATIARVARIIHDLAAELMAALADAERELLAGPNDARDTVRRLVETCRKHRDGLGTTLTELESWVHGLLGPLFVGSTFEAFDQLVGAARTVLGELREIYEAWVDDLPPFDYVAPAFDVLRFGITSLRDQATERLEELIGHAESSLQKWLVDLTSALGGDSPRAVWDTARNMIVSKIGQLAHDLADLDDLGIAGRLDEIYQAISGVDIEVAKEKLGALLAHDAWRAVGSTFKAADALAAEGRRMLDAIRATIEDETQPLGSVVELLRGQVATIDQHFRAASTDVEQALRGELRKLGKLRPVDLDAVPALELTRALATGPINDTIRCTRDLLGYYYQPARDLLAVTRSSAIVNDLGGRALNALQAAVPFDRIRDRLLPQLDGIAVRNLLPRFGALALDQLLPDLRIPNDPTKEYDWIRVRHGFDRERLTAWADVAIDTSFDDTTSLFRLPPVDVRLRRPAFKAHSRLTVARDGQRRQDTSATLSADWMMALSDKPVVTMRDGILRYDSDGGFGFSFDSEKIELAPQLQFITKALRALFPQEEGLTIAPMVPAGIRAELALPLPDLGTGAFTLTGITLYSYFELLVADGFEVAVGFWLSKPDRPFGLAILFLGGGGWLGVEARYRPPDRFSTRVSIGISAGAFIAINLGVARGSAGLLFTAGVSFYRDWSTGRGSTTLSLGLLVWGEFSILGIASASIRLVLRIEYGEGNMTGYGRLSISIKICWCFTLRVNKSVTLPFKKAGSSSRRGLSPGTPASRAGRSALAAGAPEMPPMEPATTPPIATAVALHFMALDLQ